MTLLETPCGDPEIARLTRYFLVQNPYQNQSVTKLDFSPSGDVAPRLGQAFHDGAREFYDLPGAGGCGKSLVLPEVAPNRRQGIGEGRIALGIPGGLTDDA